MALATANDIQEIYIAYYGRPADPAGLDYWLARVNTDHAGDLTAIINAFGASAEATSLYGGRTSAESVTALYQQLFGRAPEASGLQFYVDGLAAGTYTLVSIAKNILDGATGDDATVVTNRTTVANSFTTELRVDGTYAGNDAAAVARAFLATVDKTTASVTAATADLSATLADVAAGAASTEVTLTSAAETVTGSAGRDTFVGVISALSSERTLTAADSIAGGEGADQAFITIKTGFEAGFTDGTGGMSGVETVTITNAGAIARTFDAAEVTDVEKWVLESATGITHLENIEAPGVVVRIDGASSATQIIDFVDSMVTGTSDAMTLELNASSINSLTLAGIEELTVKTLGTTSNTISVTSTVTDIMAEGAGTLTIALASSSAAELIDASDRTGATTMTVTNGTSLETVLGGSGADTITSAATSGALESISGGAGNDAFNLNTGSVRANATIDGGAGTDTLTLDGAAKVMQATMTGVENLVVAGITGDLTFDGTNVTGLTAVKVTTANANVTFSEQAAGAFTLEMAGANTSSGKTVTLDAEGDLTVTRTSTAAQKTAKADLANAVSVTNANATSLTLDLDDYTSYSGTVTAAAAESVTIDVGSSVSTAGTGSVSGFKGVVTAKAAESFTVTSAGLLSGSLNVVNALSGSITTTSSLTNDANTFSVDADDLEILEVTNAMTLDLSGSDFAKVQELTINSSKGTVTLPTLADVAVVRATGTGTSTAAETTLVLGSLGDSSHDYGISVTVSEYRGGTTITNIDTDGDITLNATGSTGSLRVSGSVTGLATASTVTLDFTGMTDNVTLNAVTGKTINIDVDSMGATGHVTLAGALTGTTVDIDAGDSAGNLTIAGNVTATTLNLDLGGNTGTFTNSGTWTVKNLDYTGQSTVSNAFSVKASAGGGTMAIDGGILADTFTLDASSAASSITVSGDLGIQSAGTSDTITVNFGSTGYGGVNLSGLTGLESATINGTSATGALAITGSSAADSIDGGSGNDTINGGAGADSIESGTGVDSLTGGSGNDAFIFDITDLATFGTNYTITSGATLTVTGADIITDFSEGDELVFAPSNGSSTTLISTTATQITGAGSTQLSDLSSSKFALVQGTYQLQTGSTTVYEFVISSTGADALMILDKDGTASSTAGDWAFLVLRNYDADNADPGGSATGDSNASYTGIVGGGG